MEYTLKMEEDHCCGGGHCGPLPGYEFHCPLCDKNSMCRTGYPLKEGQKFKCINCKGKLLVLNIDGKMFKVSNVEEEATA